MTRLAARRAFHIFLWCVDMARHHMPRRMDHWWSMSTPENCAMSKMPMAFAAIAISALVALPATAGAVERTPDGARNVERSVVRHKVRHVRHVAPRGYDEDYRESYGYASDPWFGAGTY